MLQHRCTHLRVSVGCGGPATTSPRSRDRSVQVEPPAILQFSGANRGISARTYVLLSQFLVWCSLVWEKTRHGGIVSEIHVLIVCRDGYIRLVKGLHTGQILYGTAEVLGDGEEAARCVIVLVWRVVVAVCVSLAVSEQVYARGSGSFFQGTKTHWTRVGTWRVRETKTP